MRRSVPAWLRPSDREASSSAGSICRSEAFAGPVAWASVWMYYHLDVYSSEAISFFQFFLLAIKNKVKTEFGGEQHVGQ